MMKIDGGRVWGIMQSELAILDLTHLACTPTHWKVLLKLNFLTATQIIPGRHLIFLTELIKISIHLNRTPTTRLVRFALELSHLVSPTCQCCPAEPCHPALFVALRLFAPMGRAGPAGIGSVIKTELKIWIFGRASSTHLDCGELVRHVSLEGIVDARQGLSRLFPEVKQGGLRGRMKPSFFFYHWARRIIWRNINERVHYKT